jgi:pimeloyl-ACP methyl ester carboxylesterase
MKSHLRTRYLVAVCATLFLASPLLAQSRGQRRRQPPDQFATVNGVRLHYLDWGGHGDVLLFLAGLGDSVHRFDSFAPRFLDRFHAVGFTRRGQEASAKPSTGYALRTLADDIRAFMDLKGIGHATLVGHSIAGAEMTTFAALYPTRLRALVYLDAAYDYAQAHELDAGGGLASANPDLSLEAISRASRVHPDYAAITVPALAFFVLYDTPYVTSQMDARARANSELAFRILEGGYKREQIDLFRTTVKHGRVIEWHDTNHFFFDDPKHSVEAARIIREFLQMP